MAVVMAAAPAGCPTAPLSRAQRRRAQRKLACARSFQQLMHGWAGCWHGWTDTYDALYAEWEKDRKQHFVVTDGSDTRQKVLQNLSTHFYDDSEAKMREQTWKNACRQEAEVRIEHLFGAVKGRTEWKEEKPDAKKVETEQLDAKKDEKADAKKNEVEKLHAKKDEKPDTKKDETEQLDAKRDEKADTKKVETEQLDAKKDVKPDAKKDETEQLDGKKDEKADAKKDETEQLDAKKDEKPDAKKDETEQLVCKTEEKPISGLRAAGEVAGGVPAAWPPEGETPDIFYVSEKMLDSLRGKLTRSDEVTTDMVHDLIHRFTAEEMLVPVDMRGVEQPFEDIDEMIEVLGPTGAAKAFLQAREYFDANHEGAPEEMRPQRMPAGEWWLQDPSAEDTDADLSDG